MPLPHFTKISPAADLEEPIYLNLFEISFLLPNAIAQAFSSDYLLQQATSIPLDLTPDVQTATQKYKFTTRAYTTFVSETHKTFEIKFNVNQSKDGSMTTWAALKAWYDLVWNSQTGETLYKSDIVGTIVVNQHDKRGVVIRRVIYNNCQITGIDGPALGWDSSEIMSSSGKFISDYWVDQYISEYDNTGVPAPVNVYS
jgi:hypothetical protein